MPVIITFLLLLQNSAHHWVLAYKCISSPQTELLENEDHVLCICTLPELSALANLKKILVD